LVTHGVAISPGNGENITMIRRNLTPRIEEAMMDTPVVALTGARQTGKTTLVRELARSRRGSRYLSLDDGATLAAASEDPVAFVGQEAMTLIIDEVQKAPVLLPAIKMAVDADRRPGRFILTGSANPLVLPQVSESLAGRMEILTLRPFSQGELAGRRDELIDRLMADTFEAPGCDDVEAADLLARVLQGGYPEAITRASQRRRDAWFASYITAILQRDVRDLAHVEGLSQMPRLLSLLAARSGALVNRAELSRVMGIPYTTLVRYLALLEATFLYDPLPAWAGNPSKRLTRSPKAFLCDSGLTAYLLGVAADRVGPANGSRGPLVESFVVSELRKQASWADADVTLWHFRSGRQEVDVVIEDRRGRLVGIEVKAGATLGRNDVRGLRSLADAAGKRFLRGVLLYAGSEVLPFGPDITALPISALWAED
jgi:hypothetical protein